MGDRGGCVCAEGVNQGVVWRDGKRMTNWPSQAAMAAAVAFVLFGVLALRVKTFAALGWTLESAAKSPHYHGLTAGHLAAADF